MSIVQDVVSIATTAPRILGVHAGKVWISDDFDSELPDAFWMGGDDELAA